LPRELIANQIAGILACVCAGEGVFRSIWSAMLIWLPVCVQQKRDYVCRMFAIKFFTWIYCWWVWSISIYHSKSCYWSYKYTCSWSENLPSIFIVLHMISSQRM